MPEPHVRKARPDDADAIARVHVASWSAHYRGLLTDEEIDRRTVEVRRAQWTALLDATDRVTLVADDATRGAIGFASAILLAQPEAGFHGYLHTLYLAPGATGNGLGEVLIRAVAAELQARGIADMALRTLRLNRARSFYERLGARLIDGFDYDAGHFDDVAYGFDDLRALAVEDHPASS